MISVTTNFNDVVRQLYQCQCGECQHSNRPKDCITFDEKYSTVAHRAALRAIYTDRELFEGETYES